MYIDLAPIKTRILILTELVDEPVLIENLIHYLGEPFWMINLSLAELVREEKISVEVSNGHNYVRVPDTTITGLLKKSGYGYLVPHPSERYSHVFGHMFA